MPEYERDRGRDLAVEMASFCNTLTEQTRYAAFVNTMSQQHRTLQQAFTQLVVMWLEHLASLGPRDYDPRNEASVKLAKEFVARVEERHLPFI